MDGEVIASTQSPPQFRGVTAIEYKLQMSCGYSGAVMKQRGIEAKAKGAAGAGRGWVAEIPLPTPLGTSLAFPAQTHQDIGSLAVIPKDLHPA